MALRLSRLFGNSAECLFVPTGRAVRGAALLCISTMLVLALGSPLAGQRSREWTRPAEAPSVLIVDTPGVSGVAVSLSGAADEDSTLTLTTSRGTTSNSMITFADERVLGALIGAAAGLAYGLYECSQLEGAVCAPGIAVRGGIGAVAGFLIGAFIREGK